MTEKEQTTMMIDAFINIQRIERAADRDKEIRDQKKALIAKLEALGVVVENITIE